jgi:sugar phosphate isomerase/epimerase
MKIGMLTGVWALAEAAPLIDSLRRAVALGFHYVDLQGVFHAGPRHLSPADRTAVKTEMAALGLKPRNYVLHALHNLASASHEELEQSYEYLCEGVDLAVDWGIRQMMLNAGQWAYGVSRAAAWERAVRFIQRVCDYAGPRGVYIAQESEPYVWFLVNDIESTVRMHTDVGRPNFTTLVDLGHLALAREGADDLARLADSIIHAHFSDHEPLRHTNQPVGTGFTPTAEYLEMLRDLEIDRRVGRFGYDELVVAFELGVPGEQVDDADAWVRKSLQHVQEVAPYMSLA